MRPELRTLVVSCSLMGLAGCATTPEPAADAALAVHDTPASLVLAATPAIPVVQAAPPVPLYRPPVVVEVEARPYINAANELVMPGRRFVVVDPGGWNPEALEHPERAGIPDAMRRELGTPQIIVPPHAGRHGGNGSAPPAEAPPDWLARLPWDRIVVLGLADQAAEAEAHRGAQADAAGRLPLWTPQLGWLLVPAELLGEGDGAPSGR